MLRRAQFKKISQMSDEELNLMWMVLHPYEALKEQAEEGGRLGKAKDAATKFQGKFLEKKPQWLRSYENGPTS